jgi:hypothetical protein
MRHNLTKTQNTLYSKPLRENSKHKNTFQIWIQKKKKKKNSKTIIKYIMITLTPLTHD